MNRPSQAVAALALSVVAGAVSYLLVVALTPRACGSLPAGHDRDMCYYTTSLTPEVGSPEAESVLVGLIGDAIIRNASVTGWLERHPEVRADRAIPLCGLLDRRGAAACQRRVSSVHLRRRTPP